MGTIMFVRHGETNWNKQKRLQGREDIPLNKNGINQAKEIKKNIADTKFSFILSSPLKRATQTMDICFQDQNIKKIISNDLMELNFGDLSGMDLKDALNKYEDVFNIIDDPNNPKCFNTKIPNGESKGDALLRVLSFINNFINDNEINELDNIAIFCHGGIIKYLHMLKTNDNKKIKNGFCYKLTINEINELNNKIINIMKTH